MKTPTDAVRDRLLAIAEERDLAVTVTDIEVLAEAAVTVVVSRLIVGPPDGSPVTLTNQQAGVLVGLALGDTVQATARRMCIAPFTVKSHRRAAYHALGAKSGSEAVAIAMSLGLIRLNLRNGSTA